MPSTLRIALVNPPSARPVLRDYYCTTTPKAAYLWPPIEFVQLEMALGPLCRVFDFVAAANDATAGWNASIRAVQQWHPDLIIGLIGGFTATLDAPFLAACAGRDIPLVVGGEASLSFDRLRRYFPWLSGRLRRFPDLFSCTAERLADWVEPAPDQHHLHGLLDLSRVAEEIAPPGVWQQHPRYRLPGVGGPFASVLLRYGCPFECQYCNSGYLGYRRTVMNWLRIEEHLRMLHKHGFKRLYFRDLSLGPNAAPLLELTRLLHGHPWSWSSFIRPELLTPETIPLLKKSGCCRLQIGIEAADSTLLGTLGRHDEPEMLRERLAVAASCGLAVGGHFALGLPGQTRDSVMATVDSALQLPLVHAAFNIFVPRGGTPIYENALADGLIALDSFGFDSTWPAANTPTLSDLSISELQTVVDRAYRQFYFRPHILRQLLRHDLRLIPSTLLHPHP